MVGTGKTNPLGMWRVVASHDSLATGETETQEVRGTPPVVAAWLRVVADQLDPPRPATRGFKVLPRPTP